MSIDHTLMDASELTAQEVAYFGQLLETTLAKDYFDEMQRLYLIGKYPVTPAGWQELTNEAWAATLASNAVCKEVTALSAARKRARASEAAGASGLPAGVAPGQALAQLALHPQSPAGLAQHRSDTRGDEACSARPHMHH